MYIRSINPEHNMRIFLGVFMVLIVSADEEVDIQGILGDSVHLPCNCSGRNLDREFGWQMEEPNRTRVFSSSSSTFFGRFRDKARVFVDEDINDCSLLLTNITADDQGKYKCFFDFKQQYTRFFLNLIVVANYSLCQVPAGSASGDGAKVFNCDVKGRREAEIQWFLDEKLLTDSSTVNINQTCTKDVTTGLYHIQSQLITELPWTSAPKCDINPEVPFNISYDCPPKSSQTNSLSGVSNAPTEYCARFLKIIPVVLVLGLTVVLWRLCKISHRSPKIRGEDADYFQCEAHRMNSNVKIAKSLCTV